MIVIDFRIPETMSIDLDRTHLKDLVLGKMIDHKISDSENMMTEMLVLNINISITTDEEVEIVETFAVVDQGEEGVAAMIITKRTDLMILTGRTLGTVMRIIMIKGNFVKVVILATDKILEVGDEGEMTTTGRTLEVVTKISMTNVTFVTVVNLADRTREVEVVGTSTIDRDLMGTDTVGSLRGTATMITGNSLMIQNLINQGKDHMVEHRITMTIDLK